MNDPGQRVTVVDIDIPFTRLVGIFIKWGIAAVPATIALSVIFSLVFSLLWGVLGFGAMKLPTTRL
ncbi:MAG: hypothetical protein V9G24_01640 [Rhodoblastus sp.]|jgi:hypothetical protein